MSAQHPTASIVYRFAADGSARAEAKWRSATTINGGRQVKKRLGPAWVEAREGAIVKRAGRTPAGWLDLRSVHARAAEVVAVVEVERAAQAAGDADAADAAITFRAVAHEWVDFQQRVKGVKPSTISDHRHMLVEPGTPHRRGPGTAKGRVMAQWGDRDMRTVTAKEVAQWLDRLDADADIGPRTVNKHRQVVASVFAYARRHDTYELACDPVTPTDKRAEPPPAALDYYEVHEVEALAAAAASGAHRGTQADHLTAGEREWRAWEDARDAEMLRVLFYTGMRLGEARALKWAAVDLDEGIVFVTEGVSAGVDTTPKWDKARAVPLPTAAWDCLRRVRATRDGFTSDIDYVFSGRCGERLDDSAFRRRYHRARKAVGLRSVNLHALRHAAGSITARTLQGPEVQALLGHSSSRTTDRYVRAKVTADMRERLDRAYAVEPSTIEARPR